MFDNVSRHEYNPGALKAANKGRAVGQGARCCHEGRLDVNWNHWNRETSGRKGNAFALSPHSNSTRRQPDRENICRFAPRPTALIKAKRRVQTREFPVASEEKRESSGCENWLFETPFFKESKGKILFHSNWRRTKYEIDILIGNDIDILLNMIFLYKRRKN